MRTRTEVIDFCLSLDDTYEDYPFHDFNWTVCDTRAIERCLRQFVRGWVISGLM